MAWYLATGRSPSRWMSLPTPLTVNYGTSAYTIEFELAMTNASDAQAIIGQTTNSQYNGFYFTTGGRLQVSVANSNIFFTNASYGLFDGNFHKYRFEHDAGGAWRAYRDDVLFQSSTYSGAATTSTALNALFRGGSTTATSIINIKYLEVTGFGSGSARWDATLSGGTGTVLPTVSGTNDATQSGTWPSDDSEWVFYSSGTAYSDTLSGATFTSSVGSLTSERAKADTLSGASYSSSVGNLTATRGYASTLSGISFISSVGSLTATRGYSSVLSASTYSSSIGDLTSIITSASGYDSLLAGLLYTSSLGDMLSTVQRASILNGIAFNSSIGSMTATLGYNSALSGAVYSSTVGALTSTRSGEVTVTIEGYTIKFADSAIAAAYANNGISAGYAADILEITWQH